MATVPSWTPEGVFVAGQQCIHAGNLFVAQWWTQNNLPGDTGPMASKVWKLVGPGGAAIAAAPTPAPAVAAPTPTPAAPAPAAPAPAGPVGACKAWNPTAVYVEGNTAFFNGHAWRAKWWTQNNQPGLPASNMWQDLGPGVEAPPDAWDLLDALLVPANAGKELPITDAAQLTAMWGSADPVNPATTPAAVAAALAAHFPAATYDSMFPNAFQSPAHLARNNLPPLPSQAQPYYSYANFAAAVTKIADILVLQQHNTDGTSRHVHFSKSSRTHVLLRCDPTFTRSATTASTVIDYGAFFTVPAPALQRNLAAFLANIAHETTGGWDGAPGGRYAWGLYHNEEQEAHKFPEGQYVDTGRFPAEKGKRYHGRGPIQLSWNYNYYQASQTLFGNHATLLSDPEMVTRDGTVGFMTALWFWQTPQPPKPSCQQVMTGAWQPTQADLAANRLPCFATTINVINGRLEAGIPNDARVKDRAGFYQTFCATLGVQPDEADCCRQKSW
ncbi:chitinase class I-domain-containing protein [Hyaloraphidium curvatum]|nr:chitinase class I-domain-containing protein [Hyaloraphidium curvatum]